MESIIKEFENFKTIKITTVGVDIFLVEMLGTGRRCFSIEMIKELAFTLEYIISLEPVNKELHKAIILTGLQNSNLFNLGGDLKLFVESCFNSEEETEKITLMYSNLAYKWNHLHNENIINVSIVNGDAFGGGLEVAIGSGYSIAEKGYLCGFPEVSIGFIPNAGAVEVLSRKIGANKAISMISESKTFTTEELFELSLFDNLVEQGEGLRVALKRINTERKSQNAFNTLKKIKDRIHPLSIESFNLTALTWKDLIVNLTPFHIKKIKRILALQEKKYE